MVHAGARASSRKRLSRLLLAVGVVALCLLTVAGVLAAIARGWTGRGARGASSGAGATAYSFYDNGVVRTGTPAEIERLISAATADPRTKLGPGWEQSPGYTARYFTMNLLGIDQYGEDWTQTASGGGNSVRGQAGKGGMYGGPLGQETTGDRWTVTLRTDLGKAYAVILYRPWKGGPWLVSGVMETFSTTGP